MKRFRYAALLTTLVSASTISMASVPPGWAETPKLSIAMITHAPPGDTFWDIVRKGAVAAAKNDNVKLIYLADPTASKEAQLITNVTQQRVDGVAVTLAFPAVEGGAVKAAQAVNIPVVGLNAGTSAWKQLGLLGYAGQDEFIAGQAIGDKLNKEGAKSVVCMNQSQGEASLEERCGGIKKIFKGTFQVLYVNGMDMPTARSRMVAKLQQDVGVDYVVSLSSSFASTLVEAISQSGSKAKLGTFDVNAQAISLIKSGKLQWAVDQQPFVEGYEAVDMLWLYLTNGNTVGGGGPVLTGPAFVTKANADVVAKFAGRGTR
jgi:simple sugar transport system substrate-binding protein